VKSLETEKEVGVSLNKEGIHCSSEAEAHQIVNTLEEKHGFKFSFVNTVKGEWPMLIWTCISQGDPAVLSKTSI